MSESEHKSALQIDHPALSCNWPENTTQALLKYLPWSAFTFQMRGTSWLTEGFNFHFFTADGSIVFFQLVYSNLAWPSCSAVVSVRYYRRSDGQRFTFQETYRSYKMKRMEEDRLSVRIADTLLQCSWTTDDQEHPRFVFTHKNDAFRMTLELEPTEPPIQVGQGETRYGAKGSDGYLLFQFVPCVKMRGEFQADGGDKQVLDGRGIIIHQFQGVRPNIASTRFDVTYFSQVSHQRQADDDDEDSRDIDLFMVQFRTPQRYGNYTINVGFMTDRESLVALSTGRADMLGDPIPDQQSGYKLPSEIAYTWQGRNVKGKSFAVSGNYRPREPIASISVLDTMPFFIRKAVQLLVAKPHIYKFVDEAEFMVRVEGEADVCLRGSLYHEISFVNDDPE